jgi:glycosidase
MSSELHKRGMKNIMDYVTNHWGYKHWMMNDLPTYNWIHQFPGFKQTNYRMNTQFDSNASEGDAKLYADGWFVKSMPDLNQSNPLVLNYLIQNAIWWVEYADLDGFRVDTYPYGDKSGVAKWTKAVMDEYPNFNIVGEVWYHNPAQNAYWQKDSKIGAIESFNSYFFSYTFWRSLSKFLSSEENERASSTTSNDTIQNITIDINEKTSVFEIAAATSLESAGNRCISLQLKGDYATKT